MAYNVKAPLVYSNVLINNWQSFVDLGVFEAYCPGRKHSYVPLDYPVSLGDYASPKDPSRPIVVHMEYVPLEWNSGLTPQEQYRAGRYELLAAPLEEFEQEIRAHLNGMLSAGGFDGDRDIEAMTVNRWPHGYSYEYNPLFDPDWEDGAAPHEIGRQKFGQIAIANSDAGMSPQAEVAIEQGYRAVDDLMS